MGILYAPEVRNYSRTPLITRRQPSRAERIASVCWRVCQGESAALLFVVLVRAITRLG